MSQFESEKAAILSEWEDVRSAWESGRLRGVGAPDAAMVPWCDRINSLPGLCTLQSCAGHWRGDTIETAHLWIWLSREAGTRFELAAPALAARAETIERVSKLYLADGKKVASIYFRGDERGLLGQSMEVVFAFLREVSCSSPPAPSPDTRYQAHQSSADPSS